MSSRSKECLRETRLIVTVGAPSVEEIRSSGYSLVPVLNRLRTLTSVALFSHLFLSSNKVHVLLVNMRVSIGLRTDTS